jgi:hypothetical protein
MRRHAALTIILDVVLGFGLFLVIKVLPPSEKP